ncbi:MAG: TAXI family TRAP transporter solute-binding subunit [Pseudomonadales bacterium]|nr:TAXI family TRAP transporter solute-binding subunit [Pseudomonadales bacterium]
MILWSLAQSAASEDLKLPRTMGWTAYNLGTTGYNQAVAIGKVLKDQHGVTLRVIPGKNDVSRLLPLKTGRVQFSANGVATYFAQEGVFQFADRNWGPMPLRVVMMSSGLSNQAVAVTAQSGIKSFAELRGKRVPWVRGAPALNISTEAMLACGGLTWNDVERIDYPGYDAMWNGMVDGQVDAAYATTVSGPTRKLEASPLGIYWPPVPHADEACWDRLLKVAPYFTPHTATRGAMISEASPHEGATYPYPVLITLADQSADMVHDLSRAIHEGYDDFRDADPGAIGWAMNLQQFTWVVPWHEGSVAYLKSLNLWTDQMQAHNQRLIARQQVLLSAWQELATLDIDDPDALSQAWVRLRTARLDAAGFDPVWRDEAALE